VEPDEKGTYAHVGSLRREVIEPRLSDHQGRMFKTTGQGLLQHEVSMPPTSIRSAHVVLTNPPVSEVSLNF